MQTMVVGGGIAGLGAALFLARRGQAVTVIERRCGTVDKVCGEGILPFGVALLDTLGLAERAAALGRRFSGVVSAHGGARAEGVFPDGVHGIGIARADLHGLLRDAARAAGVALLEGDALLPDAVPANTRILAADGIQSRWAAWAGVSRRISPRLGLRFRLKTPPPDKVTVHFLKHMEVYLTPTGPDTLSVAFLLDAPRLGVPGGRLKAHCLEVFARHFPMYAHLEPEDAAMRGPICALPRRLPSSVHLLGDAAAAFDPISGAGMSFALLCARLAADHLDDPEAYRRALAPHMRAIGMFTGLVLAFRGGGLRSGLMVRRLARAPKCFNRILALHDGSSPPYRVGLRHALSLLRP